jgi:hypothetical protein
MARPEGEVHGDNRESLSRLVARMPRVVFMQRMHQKIVVVDRQWSIVGSMNMLSHGPTSARRIRDIMFTMDGARFADRLLRQELADELGQIRQCLTCSRTLTECGLVGSGADRGWSWIWTADRTHRLKSPSAAAPYDQRRNDRRRTWGSWASVHAGFFADLGGSRPCLALSVPASYPAVAIYGRVGADEEGPRWPGLGQCLGRKVT